MDAGENQKVLGLLLLGTWQDKQVYWASACYGQGTGGAYFLRSHIFEVLTHHDAPELGFNETLGSFSLSRPRKKTYRKLQKYEKEASEGRLRSTGLESQTQVKSSIENLFRKGL